jgi:S-formylglutathione hydrolase FrmB
LDLFSEHACFGGTQRHYRHQCSEIGLQMPFSGFLPPAAAMGKVPALFYLAGLTCNEETFMTKAGAQRVAYGNRSRCRPAEPYPTSKISHFNNEKQGEFP